MNSTSHIDYFIVSPDIINIVKSITPILDTPWGPHIGLKVSLIAAPRAIQGKVLCVPKALPVAIFKQEWEKLDEHQQSIL